MKWRIWGVNSEKHGKTLVRVVMVLVIVLVVGCGVPIQRGEKEQKSEKTRVAYLWIAGMTTVLYIYLVTYSGKH